MAAALLLPKTLFNIHLGLFGNTLAALQPITKLIEPNPNLRSVRVNSYTSCYVASAVPFNALFSLTNGTNHNLGPRYLRAI